MPTDQKKTRKKRGHVSCGHGRVGKHRKHPGGRGNAGGQHHHKILFDKYHPNYFGKRGMRYFRKTKQKNYCPIMNLDKICSLVSQTDSIKQNNSSNLNLVGLNDLNAFKILGKGKTPKVPLLIKAKFFSKKAKKKFNNLEAAVLQYHKQTHIH
nr:60S ribosomal protein L27A [Cryptomonas curvata]